MRLLAPGSKNPRYATGVVKTRQGLLHPAKLLDCFCNLIVLLSFFFNLKKRCCWKEWIFSESHSSWSERCLCPWGLMCTYGTAQRFKHDGEMVSDSAWRLSVRRVHSKLDSSQQFCRLTFRIRKREAANSCSFVQRAGAALFTLREDNV